MMRILSYCSVITCKNCCSANDPEANGITFHKFPTDPSLKEKWIRATGRQNWTPTKNSTICSKHFDEDYFSLGSERRLDEDAIPTVDVAAIPIAAVPMNTGLLANDVIDLDDDDQDMDVSNVEESSEGGNETTNTVGKLYSDWSNVMLTRKIEKLIDNNKKNKKTIKCLKVKLLRQAKKVELLNRIINDLMEMYGLKSADITILKNAIIKAEKLEKASGVE